MVASYCLRRQGSTAGGHSSFWGWRPPPNPIEGLPSKHFGHDQKLFVDMLKELGSNELDAPPLLGLV
ncbi:hypothetical protein F2Q70_00022045 [Brassica cretica]|uniref:Uncharacterized protein n=1 Tax=Brassica cretica TaxID=69181 RepID=A0A8S9GQJ1_BRACR|nr:hypothetical protein F2Q70_00022045 [Brassica cretica]